MPATTRTRRKPKAEAAPEHAPVRAYVEPRYDYSQDHGEGGIKQVIRHVAPYLEALGVSFVDDREQADVIWYHASPYTETRNWLYQHPEVAVVASCHGLYWADYDWDKASLAANADVLEGLRMADVVTAPSEWVKGALDRGILADVRAVYHGVDLREWEPVDSLPDVPYVLWDKSRVDPVCDPAPALELAQLMRDQRFVLCAGPDNIAASMPNVVVLGRIPYDQSRELTRNAAVYLCVTRETFGLATLQAMAAGVPVVGWRYAGQKEIIRDEKDGGLLVEPGNVEALADAVVRALANRAALAVAARQRAESFTWQRAAEQYRKAFDDALAAHTSAVRCTVITTAYNAEKTIGRTIESALAALGPDDEYIVVDDASTDGTRAKILSYAKGSDGPQMYLLTQDENGYLAHSRNNALNVAKGRYVTCLDADDELMPEALNILAGELDRDRSTQIAYGRVHFMDDFPDGDGGIVSRPAEYGFGPGVSRWPFPFDWAAQAEARNVTCMPYSSMVRTAWLKRAGGWRTRCRTGEDLDLWMRLVSFGARPRMVTDANVLTYHTSTTSMSATNRLPDWGKWYPWTVAAGIISMPPFGLAFPPPKQQAWPVGHNSAPMVSVVIPVGPGHERYVLDALDSIMAQTYRRWECIVVCNTGGELQSMPPWVRLVQSPKKSIAVARNAGLARASAPYVVFLDADDYLDRSALDYLVAALEGHPELAVAYPDYWERTAVSADVPVQWQYVPHKLDDWDCERAQGEPQMIEENGILRASLPGSIYSTTAIYRTDAVRAVGGFDPKAPGHEDADLHMALAYAGYCAAHIPRRLFVYNLATGTRRLESKAIDPAVIEWLADKYRGREKMACGSCGGRAAYVEPIAAALTQEVVLTGAMTEVEYIGEKAGGFTVRGAVTGMTYLFSKGDAKKPVMNEDLQFFKGHPEYVVKPSAQRQPDDAMPELTIDGPPSGHRARVA